MRKLEGWSWIAGITSAVITVVSLSWTVWVYINPSESQPVMPTFSSSITGSGNLILNNSKVAVSTLQSEEKHGAELSTPDHLAISYARLFGAYQVPYYLVGHTNFGLGISSISGGKNSEKIEKFFSSWEYSNAIAVKTPAWDELFDKNGLQGEWLLIRANKGDKIGEWYVRYLADKDADNVVDRYLRQRYPHKWKDGYFDNESYEGRFGYYVEAKGASLPSKDIVAHIEKNSNKIGFLVLYLRNLADKPLLDISIDSRIVLRNNFENEVAVQTVDTQLLEVPEKQNIIPIIYPKEKIFFLLSIYRKGDDEFPETYLSSVAQPVRITYRVQGGASKIEQIIRQPLRDKAAKFYMPFGWYGQ